MDTENIKGRISIIVPVYNVAIYLEKCLSSIINQSYKDYEVILVNDGSTDESSQMCDEYANEYKSITVIHSTNNGPAHARNLGIQKAKGEFIMFLDADDFLEELCLSILIEKVTQNDADIVVGNFSKLNLEYSNLGLGDVFNCDEFLTKIQLVNYTRQYLKKPNRFSLFVYSWGRLFKTSIIKNNKIKFDENLHTFEDVAFNYEYLKYAYNLCYLNEHIYNHVVHSNYSSATMKISEDPERLFGYKKALRNIEVFLDDFVEKPKLEEEVGHAYICYTIIQLVRLCGQYNSDTAEYIKQYIESVVNNSILRKNLKFYKPTNGDSKILPILMRIKFVQSIIWVCNYKANKRYRK